MGTKATTFSLPAALSSYAPGFVPVGGTAYQHSCDDAGSPYGFTVQDQTGDGLLYLVVHFDQCRSNLGLGRAAWWVYPGICSGR